MEFINNVEIFKSAYREIVDRAWETIGLLAEGKAVKYCSADTGRLRNSINHATVLGGGEDSYKDENGKLYSGRSARTIPPHGVCVIGTNVEYAMYQEFGTSKIDAANNNRGFLRPAITDHINEYSRVMEQELAALNDV